MARSADDDGLIDIELCGLRYYKIGDSLPTGSGSCDVLEAQDTNWVDGCQSKIKSKKKKLHCIERGEKKKVEVDDVEKKRREKGEEKGRENVPIDP